MRNEGSWAAAAAGGEMRWDRVLRVPSTGYRMLRCKNKASRPPMDEQAADSQDQDTPAAAAEQQRPQVTSKANQHELINPFLPSARPVKSSLRHQRLSPSPTSQRSSKCVESKLSNERVYPKTCICKQGRAKKRVLYNRRFVNVTLTGGKRKYVYQSLSTSIIAEH